MTDDDVEECIEIKPAGPDRFHKASIRLHTTEAIDLHRKLGNALSDWVAESAYFFATGEKLPRR